MLKKTSILILFLILIFPIVLAKASEESQGSNNQGAVGNTNNFNKKANETLDQFRERMKNVKFSLKGNTGDTASENRPDSKFFEQKKQEKEQKKLQLCQNIQTKITEKVTRFTHVKEVHYEKYTKLRARLTDIAGKLKAKGLDTKQLEKDLVTFDGLVNDYKKAYTEFINSLSFTKGHACDDTDVDFKTSMDNSKALLQGLHEKRAAIREFYKNNIRLDLQNLRKQASAKIDENKNSNNTGDTESNSSSEEE